MDKGGQSFGIRHNRRAGDHGGRPDGRRDGPAQEAQRRRQERDEAEQRMQAAEQSRQAAASKVGTEFDRLKDRLRRRRDRIDKMGRTHAGEKQRLQDRTHSAQRERFPRSHLIRQHGRMGVGLPFFQRPCSRDTLDYRRRRVFLPS